MADRKSSQPLHIKLRLKLAIGDDSIGPGKADLLKKINRHGSISAAARDMGINYRRAWFLLETINSAVGQPVVLTTKGGKHGGGAKLTATGSAILAAYENCVQAADDHARDHLDRLRQNLIKHPEETP